MRDVGHLLECLQEQRTQLRSLRWPCGRWSGHLPSCTFGVLSRHFLLPLSMGSEAALTSAISGAVDWTMERVAAFACAFSSLLWFWSNLLFVFGLWRRVVWLVRLTSLSAVATLFALAWLSLVLTRGCCTAVRHVCTDAEEGARALPDKLRKLQLWAL